MIKYTKSVKYILSSIVAFILIIIALFSPLLAPFEYDKIGTGKRLMPPSKEHFFGTDQFGRDVFSRVIVGTRYSLAISFLVLLFSNILGVTLGSVAGYFGGKVDLFLMRIVDVLFTIPWFITGIIVVLLIGKGIIAVTVTLSLFYSPQIARIVRGCALSIKEKDYVQAGVLSGESKISIIFRYILRNSLGPITVQSTMIVAYAMLTEAALSYLGYGIPPPIPSWGLMLQNATQYYFNSRHLLYFPGLAIVISVVTFSFLGDSLRDLWDPKLQII